MYILPFLLAACIAMFPCRADAQRYRPSQAFTILTEMSWVKPGEGHEILNMPVVRTQAGMLSCFGCAAATIVQKFLCDNDPMFAGPNGDCSRVPPSRLVSQLDMVAWAETNNPIVSPTPRGQPNDDIKDPDNHTNIRFGTDRSEYSASSNAIVSASTAFAFMPETCYSSERLSNLYDNSTGGAARFKAAYEQARLLYTSLHKNNVTSSDAITTAIGEISKGFNTRVTAEALLKAAKKSSYGEFLYSVLFEGCARFTSSVRPRAMRIPDGLNREDALDRIHQVLSTDYPVLLSSICLTIDVHQNSCVMSHDLVISGFRLVCTSSDPAAKCKNQLKVQNCWGNEWQVSNNSGWVDAAELLRHVSYGQPTLDKGDIAWYEPLRKRKQAAE